MSRGKSRRSLELIEASHEILDEIQPASIRAVCYRLFTEGLIESMARSETNRVPLETKQDDPRHKWYRDDANYGECWELDALSPVILRERVEAAIVERLDRPVWDRYVAAEVVERESITKTVQTWRTLAGTPA